MRRHPWQSIAWLLVAILWGVQAIAEPSTFDGVLAVVFLGLAAASWWEFSRRPPPPAH